MCCMELLTLLLVSSLAALIEFGLAEDVIMKVSLKNRWDGKVVARVCVGDETSRVLRNLGVEFKIDATLDHDEKLNDAHGLVKEIDSKKRIELSNFNELQKDLENKRLRRLLCPEKGEEDLNITIVNRWIGTRTGTYVITKEKRTQPADLLIVNGATYTSGTTDYIAWMQTIKGHQMGNFGDFLVNFWISDDGKLFDGVGWDSANFIGNGGFGLRAQVIAFMKKDANAAPSEAAMKTFRQFIKTAICKRRLSLHYRILPYYLIHDDPSISKNNFDQNGMRKWDWYVENLDQLLVSEGNKKLAHEIVSRYEWSEKRRKEDFTSFSSPIDYIIVMEYAGRCFLNCDKYLQELERAFERRNEVMEVNFVLSEDGRAFEIMGWGRMSKKRYRCKNAILVWFLGTFRLYSPRRSMLHALETLIRDGLVSGKLSRNYKVVPVKAFFPNSGKEIGRGLEEKIKNFKRYSSVCDTCSSQMVGC